MKDNVIFVGIDVSKDKHDICIKDSNGNELTRRFQIVNTKKDLNVLYATIDKLTKTKGITDVIFGMEATGIYYLPLFSALKRDGYPIRLYNPIQTHGYRKMEIRKTKTDSIDAAIIADMLRYSEPPLANGFQDLKLYQLRELARSRQRLVDYRTKIKIQLIRDLDMTWSGYTVIMPKVFGKTSMAILKRYAVPSEITTETFEQFYELIYEISRGQITSSKALTIYNHARDILAVPEVNLSVSFEIKMLISQIEMYDQQILDVEMEINQIMKQVNSKIISIPGISDILGAAILGEIGDINRFGNVKQLVAFAGLDPAIRKSGRQENKTGPISKRGSPLLRHALFLAANVARQNDETLKRYFNKKMNEGKHYHSALNATAAKVLRIVFWVLKNDKEYKPVNL